MHYRHHSDNKLLNTVFVCVSRAWAITAHSQRAPHNTGIDLIINYIYKTRLTVTRDIFPTKLLPLLLLLLLNTHLVILIKSFLQKQNYSCVLTGVFCNFFLSFCSKVLSHKVKYRSCKDIAAIFKLILHLQQLIAFSFSLNMAS